jgi:methionine-rich copper-binding protein CopC
VPSHRIRIAVLALAVPTVLALAAAPASAHNELQSSSPATGARLSAVPGSVVLTFEENTDPRFVKVKATGPDGQSVAAGPPQTSGATVRQPLTPGTADGLYTVTYRVVSKDGHPVQGSVTFTAGTSTGPILVQPAMSGGEPGARKASPTHDAERSWPGYAIGGAVAVVLAGAAAALLLFRRRPQDGN